MIENSQISPQPLTEIEKIIQGPVGDLELKYHQGSNQKLFVMCHPHPLYQGTMENKVVNIAIKAMADLGFSTVRFNYRGVGKSQGVYGKGEGEFQDLLAVVEWAMQNLLPTPAHSPGRNLSNHEKNQKLYLGGFSFGCYVAYRGAGVLNPERLLMIAPAIQHMDFDALPAPTMPWLVIQGEADEVVSAEATYVFLEKHQMGSESNSQLNSQFNSHSNSQGNFQGESKLLKKMPGVGHFFHGQLLPLKAVIQDYYVQVASNHE
jgi:alpha/beta superfamily hydrolase